MAGKKASHKFCYKCGSEMPSDYTYCRVCGYGGKTINNGATSR